MVRTAFRSWSSTVAKCCTRRSNSAAISSAAAEDDSVSSAAFRNSAYSFVASSTIRRYVRAIDLTAERLKASRAKWLPNKVQHGTNRKLRVINQSIIGQTTNGVRTVCPFSLYARLDRAQPIAISLLFICDQLNTRKPMEIKH